MIPKPINMFHNFNKKADPLSQESFQTLGENCSNFCKPHLLKGSTLMYLLLYVDTFKTISHLIRAKDEMSPPICLGFFFTKCYA